MKYNIGKKSGKIAKELQDLKNAILFSNVKYVGFCLVDKKTGYAFGDNNPKRVFVFLDENEALEKLELIGDTHKLKPVRLEYVE